MMMKTTKHCLSVLLLTTLFFISNSSFAQPEIEWQRSYGGSLNDWMYSSIQETIDGGYIIAGSSESNDGDVTINNGESDYWVLKLDISGNIEWQKSHGGSNTDNAFSVQQTSDEGYIIAGTSNSNDGDVSGNQGNWDVWVVKLNHLGFIQWQKSLGGSNNEGAHSIQQTTDDGYIIGGYTNSNDGDVSGNNGSNDCWIVKLDSFGNIQWQKTLGGSGNDVANSVQQTTDGGFVMAGFSNSSDGDVSENHGGLDYWIVKMDDVGTIQWQKSYGGSNNDMAESIVQTNDGGYFVSGQSYSTDGNITENQGGIDFWVIKLDSEGNLQWQKSLGGSNDDISKSCYQTADGNYVVAGFTDSNDGHVTENNGLKDYWIVKLNNVGNILWQKTLGGSSNDLAFSIQQTADSGFIVGGHSLSSDGDVTENRGNYDLWIVKLYPNTVSVQEHDTLEINIYPNPAKNTLYTKTKNQIVDKYSIYSISGVLIQEHDMNTVSPTIDVKSLTSGMYFIQLQSGKEIASRKFVKE
jgi:hypothetical protein